MKATTMFMRGLGFRAGPQPKAGTVIGFESEDAGTCKKLKQKLQDLGFWVKMPAIQNDVWSDPRPYRGR